MIPISDWHTREWQQLQQQRRQGRLPHAVLLSGAAGIGKAEFARQLTRSLLCQQPDPQGHACGECSACARFNAGTHPDALLIAPEEESKAIKVDQIRALIGDLSLASHYGGYRILVLSPADAMNISAANSLLKTLEEPPANSLLLLVSAMPSRLPATIRSRCQLLRLHVPAPDQVRDWLAAETPGTDSALLDAALAVSQGAPLLARHYLQEQLLEEREQFLKLLGEVAGGGQPPVAAAALPLKLSPGRPIQWWYDLVSDLIRARYQEYIPQQNKHLEMTLQTLSRDVDLQGLYLFLDQVQDASRLLQTPVNPALLWEDLFIRWRRLYPTTPHAV